MPTNLMDKERALSYFRFVFGSEKPGTGSSTAVLLFSQRLDLKAFSSSSVHRAIVAHYVDWTQKNHYEDSQVTWDFFENLYLHSPNKVELIEKYLDNSLSGERALVRFKENQQTFSKNLEFWTKIPDIFSHEALSTYHIIEGKLAVIIDQIIGDFPSGVHFVFRIFLTADPEVSAERVLNRKIAKGEVARPTSNEEKQILLKQTIENNEKRIKGDKASYSKTYSTNLLTGQPISFELKKDLEKRDDVLVIDTTEKDPEQVFAEILSYVRRLLTIMKGSSPALDGAAWQALREIEYKEDHDWQNVPWTEGLEEYWGETKP